MSRSATDQRILQEALQEIADRNGGELRAEVVRDAARDPASPLHKFFNWDVQEAAEAHWLETARRLIRSVKLVVHTETVRLTVPAFIRHPDVPVKQQGYISVVKLRTDEDLARDALVSEFARAAAALDRARRLAVALGLQEEVTLLADRLGVLQAAVAQAPGAAAGQLS